MSSRTEPPFLEKSTGRRRLRRLAWSVLLIVVAAHIIAGLGSAAFIVAHYFSKPSAQFTTATTPKMKPEEREARVSMAEAAAMQRKPVFNNRIQSLKPSQLALPELPTVPVDAITTMNVQTSAVTAVIGAGTGTSGGSGRGTGTGFFGGKGAPGSGLLEGTFYDLKQDKNRKPTEMDGRKTEAKSTMYTGVIRRFVNSWNPAALSHYFTAPTKLFNTQFSIPILDSREGPKQFRIENDVKPGYWLAHYVGRVIAPESGRFRFVGAGDNVLIVRFGGRVVLDASWSPIVDFTRGKLNIYTYENLHQFDGWYGGRFPGHVVGKTFTVKKGEAYNMEVLIGEMDGGRFNCTLLIEQLGANYQKDSHGNPILPFFKQKASDLENRAGKAIPPFDSNAPIWLPAPMVR